MSSRRQCIADLAGYGCFRDPIQRLLVRTITLRPAPIWWPRDRHGRLALQEGREILHETKLLHAGRHEFVLVAHAGEHLDADIGVDRGLHGISVEELAALIAEAFLEHVHRVRGLSEEGAAVDTFALEDIRKTSADNIEICPGLGYCEVLAGLILESLLYGWIIEEVAAVVHQENVAIIGEAINLAAHFHLVVAVGRRNRLELGGITVFLDVGVERLERASLDEIGHPGRNNVERVICSGARLVVLHDLGEHLSGRDLDYLYVHAGQLFPLRTGEVGGIERLKTGLPDNSDRASLVLLRGLDGGVGGRCGPCRPSRCRGEAGGQAYLSEITSIDHCVLPFLEWQSLSNVPRPLRRGILNWQIAGGIPPVCVGSSAFRALHD